MWQRTAATFLATGLALICVQASEVDSTFSLSARPDLTSPYQPYDLALRPFCPAPSRMDGVLLHVRINNGRPLRLLVDSGAECIVVNAKVARSVGVTTGPGLDLVGLGTKSSRMAVAETVGIGPISYRKCPLAVIEGRVVEGADGVIPLAIFSDFLVRLDLPGKALRLAPYPGLESPPSRSKRGLARRDLLLIVTVLNGKHRGYAVLDTGAYSSAISREVAGHLGGFQSAQDVRVAAGTGNAPGKLVSSAVQFEIAGQRLVSDTVVATDLSNLSRHYGVEVVGVLGFPALKPYVLTVDYREGWVRIDSEATASSRW